MKDSHGGFEDPAMKPIDLKALRTMSKTKSEAILKVGMNNHDHASAGSVPLWI